jgi:hypothetical protein
VNQAVMLSDATRSREVDGLSQSGNEVVLTRVAQQLRGAKVDGQGSDCSNYRY